MLCQFIHDNAQLYKKIYKSRDIDKEDNLRSLDVVKQFIIEKGLILYGGIAIDYSMRLKNDKIYDDDTLPDYDVLSTNNVDDAYELADILLRHKFKNVSAIRRIHVQTMGVRINFIDVADISYIPPEIFNKMPTLTYDGLRIIHPDFQRMDIHMSLSFPFAGQPREAIFHRFEKDITRFRMIDKYYPIKSGKDLNVNNSTIGGKPSSSQITILLPKNKSTFAIHGFAAYYMLYEALVELNKICGNKKIDDSLIPDIDVKFVKNHMTVSGGLLNIKNKITIATHVPEDIANFFEMNNNNKTKWYAPYMDITPMVGIIDDVAIYSVRNKLLSVSKIADNYPLSVSPQYLLLYFLCNAQYTTDIKKRNIFVEYYVKTINLIEEAISRIVKLSKKYKGDMINKLINTSPFGLTTRMMGKENNDIAYLISISKISNAIGITPKINTPSLIGLPENYYPKVGYNIKPTKFNYEKNNLFWRSGEKLDRALGYC